MKHILAVLLAFGLGACALELEVTDKYGQSIGLDVEVDSAEERTDESVSE